MSTANRIILAGVFLTLVSSGVLADDVWLTDAAQASKIAKEQNKDLLLLFTGSDWCPPCMKLEEEVFSQADFLQEAQQQFVSVSYTHLTLPTTPYV